MSTILRLWTSISFPAPRREALPDLTLEQTAAAVYFILHLSVARALFRLLHGITLFGGGDVAFRRNTNRHDWWIKHRDESAAKLAEIGLPAAVYETERDMREFLTTGRREDLGLDLEALPEDQFWKLFHFATSTFDYDAADFTALEKRRLGGCSSVE